MCPVFGAREYAGFDVCELSVMCDEVDLCICDVVRIRFWVCDVLKKKLVVWPIVCFMSVVLILRAGLGKIVHFCVRSG